MQQYTIAGHTIEIYGEKLESLPGFDSFRTKTNEYKPLLTISNSSMLQEWNILPVFTHEHEGVTYDLSVKNNIRLFRMKQKDGSCILAEIRPEDGVFQSEIETRGHVSDESIRFVCWLLFGIAALSRQTVSVHASTVMYRDKSTLFLGESGTGKSTQTSLWLKHIPDTELLNDDGPCVRLESDGSIRVYGSPWSGKTPCYKNQQTPIAAFVRLSQAPHNHIRRLKGIEAIGALQPSCPFAFAYDKQLSESIYSILSSVLQQIPVYHLECLPDAGAALLAFNTLKQDGCL